MRTVTTTTTTTSTNSIAFQQCTNLISDGIYNTTSIDSTSINAQTTNDNTTTTIVVLVSCLIQQLQYNEQQQEHIVHDTIRSILLVLCGTLVFIMQAGFAMLCAGCVRKKNIQNTMLKNLLDACGSAIAFYMFGFAFAFGSNDNNNDYNNMSTTTTTTTTINSNNKTFMGTSNFFLMNYDDYSFWFYQYTFSAAVTTIVAGAIAERCQMSAYLCYSFLLSGWVYPIIVHTFWSHHGYLSPYTSNFSTSTGTGSTTIPLFDSGVIDFAGGAVVHITGGLSALFACIILGPRRGRFHNDNGDLLDVPRTFKGSSDALQMLGTFLLWFGWYGFSSGNAILYEYNSQHGSEAALAAVNTTLSAATSGIISMLCNYYYNERCTGEGIFNITHLRNGVIIGLVSSTSGCAVVEPWGAIVIGIVAGISYLIANSLLLKYHIDDAVDAIPVHLTGGIVSLVMTGLLASPRLLLSVYGRNTHYGLFYSIVEGKFNIVLLGIQLLGILCVCVWVMIFMIPFFTLLDYFGMFRSDPLEEIVGLDTSYHGGLSLINSLIPTNEKNTNSNNNSTRVRGIGGSSSNNNNDDNYNDDSYNDHIEEYKRRRLEARAVRLRVLQNLRSNNNDNGDDDDDNFNDSHHQSLIDIDQQQQQQQEEEEEEISTIHAHPLHPITTTSGDDELDDDNINSSSFIRQTKYDNDNTNTNTNTTDPCNNYINNCNNDTTFTRRVVSPEGTTETNTIEFYRNIR